MDKEDFLKMLMGAAADSMDKSSARYKPETRPFKDEKECLVHLKRYATLKPGDLIMFPHQKYGVIPGVFQQFEEPHHMRADILYYDPEDREADFAQSSICIKAIMFPVEEGE